MVTRVVGKVDKERRASLEKTVVAVQSLLVASRLGGWSVRSHTGSMGATRCCGPYQGSRARSKIRRWSGRYGMGLIWRRELEQSMGTGSRRRNQFMWWLGESRKESGLEKGLG